MEWIISAAVAAGGFMLLRFLARRAATIAELAVEDGVIRVARGGIPAAVLGDLGDCVRDPPVRAATVRIVRAVRHAQVEIKGAMSPGQMQRIRNVIGNVPLARLASATNRGPDARRVSPLD